MNDEPDSLDQHDTPTSRATINRVSIDELDETLDKLRARRLVRVQALEAIAKVDSDKQRLLTYMKFERQYRLAKSALIRAQEQEAKAEAAIHKCRMLVMTMDMEVEARELTNAE